MGLKRYFFENKYFATVSVKSHFAKAEAIEFAIADERIPYVTFLLPPSRKNLGALKRIGSIFVDEIDYEGEKFLKYRLETP